MKRLDAKAIKEHDKSEPVLSQGKDEMNLAEFPFASLRRRGDSRKVIVYEGWVTDKDGNRLDQKWTVEGGSLVGLPNEFDERTYVALMCLTAQRGFEERRVPFSVYKLLKIMGRPLNKQEYTIVEQSLDRLAKVTIKSEQAFWDAVKEQRITTVEAFHIIDRYWLRYREKEAKVREREGVPGYILWGEVIWNSLKAHYFKPLDLQFFYSLESPTARRLYRFLDKRMWKQDRYEIDIFDLAGRLGMVYYAKPAWIARKLQPAFDELLAKGFLGAAEVIKHDAGYRQYTRIRFVKSGGPAPNPAEPYDGAQEDSVAYEDRYTAQLNAVRKRYGITDELVDIWEEALVEIKGATTQSIFHTWFTQTHLLAVKDHIALIGVPSTYAQEWLAGHMTPVIKRALTGAVGHPVDELSFQVVTLPKTED